MNAIIMAQGQQQRVQHLLVPPLPAFKQLLQFFDTETIFSRTCSHLFGTGVEMVAAVVHWHSEWIRACVDNQIPFLSQDDPGGSVVGAIYHYRKLWGTSILIVLGDVVFSSQAIRTMVTTDPSQSAFFGRHGPNPITGKSHWEVYAVRICLDGRRRFLEAMADPTWRRNADTKLHDLVRALPSIPFVEISDYTDDIDTEEDYVKRFPILKRAVSEDR